MGWVAPGWLPWGSTGPNRADDRFARRRPVADLEWELGGSAEPFPQRPLCSCMDDCCPGDPGGAGCVNVTLPAGRFEAGADGTIDHGPRHEPIEWLQAHPSGFCRTGDPGCMGECGG